MSWSLVKEDALRTMVRGGVPYHEALGQLGEVSDAEVDQVVACTPGDGRDVLPLDAEPGQEGGPS